MHNLLRQRSLITLACSLFGLTVLAAVLSGLSSFAGEGPPQQGTIAAGRIEWIDVHVHLVAGKKGAIDYEGAVAATVAGMDEAATRQAVIMPPPQVFGTPPPYDYDDFIAALKKVPGRFRFLGGGGTLNPMIQGAGASTAISEDLKRRFEEKANEIIKAGAAGFGEIAAHHLSYMHGHPYESVPADHPLFLLLADTAARHDAVIDLHLDPVTEDIPLPTDDIPRPGKLTSPPNPQMLRANMSSFERLLEHNRKAKIVWAHAGSDPIGHWTVTLSRRLLQTHPNLFMSLRMGGGEPRNLVFDAGGTIKPAWMSLFRDFPDRFVIGNDQFIASPLTQGSGPGLAFAKRAPLLRQRTKNLLSRLPSDLARKIGHENAVRLYHLGP